MSYYETTKIIKEIIHFLRDIIQYILSDKHTRKYIKKVPYYCRHKCDIVYYCRNPLKEWKCRKGCIILNEELIDDEDFIFQIYSQYEI